MPDPRVSVVIPSYNHGAYIERAVRSVLEAPFADLELLVIDDGSTDDSLERLETFCGDPRVRLRAQENRGAHAALNRGLEASRGGIVFLLNSDDSYAPDRLTRFVERFAEDPELVLLASWLEVVDPEDRSLGIKKAWHNMPPWPRPCPGPGLAELSDPALALLETNYISTTSNVAFRRRPVVEGGIRFQNLRYTHDWDFFLSVAALGRFALLEEPLVFYRVHRSNTIREGRDEARGEMRFEILWSVVRHALRICRHKGDGRDPEKLYRRMWNGLPRFGYESILTQLVALRGPNDTPPAAYDALLSPGHPFRRAAIRVLAQGGD